MQVTGTLITWDAVKLCYIHLCFYKQIIKLSLNLMSQPVIKNMRDDHICLFHSEEELVSLFYLHENPESEKDLESGH